MKHTIPELCIVVPCYNEEDVLPETQKVLNNLLQLMIDKMKIKSSSKIYFVDDGSMDKTWKLVEAYSKKNNNIKGIKLSRNYGHQKALLAGLLNVPGDVVVSIDADLQDECGVIESMIEHFISGSQIVYGVRKERKTDTFFKRATAELFYRLLSLMGVDAIFNHADYRLMSRKALEALKEYSEVNIFLRGIIPTIGLESSTVQYDRNERFAGESKYPLKKMLALAIDGITSFSAFPLRLIAVLGLTVFMASFVLSFWVLWVKFFTDSAIPGWASAVLPMYFLGGIQLLSIGVLGEYISKIYMETKNRPKYVIEKIV